MKKITLLALIAILCSACINETREIVQEVAPSTFTRTYTIFADEMVKRTDLAGIYFEREFREPALTNWIFDNGVLQAFLYYRKDGRDTMCPLPFSDFLIDEFGYQWEEQFTVEFQPGFIKFIQKISDHALDPPIADSYDVLVRFLW